MNCRDQTKFPWHDGSRCGPVLSKNWITDEYEVDDSCCKCECSGSDDEWCSPEDYER